MAKAPAGQGPEHRRAVRLAVMPGRTSAAGPARIGCRVPPGQLRQVQPQGRPGSCRAIARRQDAVPAPGRTTPTVSRRTGLEQAVALYLR